MRILQHWKNWQLTKISRLTVDLKQNHLGRNLNNWSSLFYLKFGTQFYRDFRIWMHLFKIHLLNYLFEFVKRQRSEFHFYEEKRKDKSVEKEYKQSSMRLKKRESVILMKGDQPKQYFLWNKNSRLRYFLKSLKLSSALQHRLDACASMRNLAFLQTLLVSAMMPSEGRQPS